MIRILRLCLTAAFWAAFAGLIVSAILLVKKIRTLIREENAEKPIQPERPAPSCENEASAIGETNVFGDAPAQVKKGRLIAEQSRQIH